MVVEISIYNSWNNSFPSPKQLTYSMTLLFLLHHKHIILEFTMMMGLSKHVHPLTCYCFYVLHSHSHHGPDAHKEQYNMVNEREIKWVWQKCCRRSRLCRACDFSSLCSHWGSSGSSGMPFTLYVQSYTCLYLYLFNSDGSGKVWHASCAQMSWIILELHMTTWLGDKDITTPMSWVLTSRVTKSGHRNVGCHIWCFSSETLKNM